MRLAADAHLVTRANANIVAGALALGMHALFVLLLVFGVSWQTEHPAPVMVDLWPALPAATRPVAIQPPEPVKPAPVPKPPPPAPAPKPVADEPPPPKAPDIALEKKQAETARLKKLKAIQEAEDKALEDAARAEADALKKKRDQQAAEQRSRELLRQMEADELAQSMAGETAANAARAAAGKRQAALAQAVGQYRDLIRAYDERFLETLGGAIQPVVKILRALKQLGYPLYGLSNWPAEKFALTRPRYPFFEWFDQMVISGEVGLVKPDPAIFALLLERIGRPRFPYVFELPQSAKGPARLTGGVDFDQHLARAGGRRHAGADVHGDAGNVGVAPLDLSGVHPGADLETEQPSGAADRVGSEHAAARPIEGRQEPVPGHRQRVSPTARWAGPGPSGRPVHG